MDKDKKYKTTLAFRAALEDRLKAISKNEGKELGWLRNKIAFERLLERLFQGEAQKEHQFLLKGGYGIEIALEQIGRTTKDIDICLPTSYTNEKVREILQECLSKDIGDWFTFLIGISTTDLQQPKYGGWRYPIEAKLGEKVFSKFHLDMVVGEKVIVAPKSYKGHDLLGFAGIEPATIMIISFEQQFAEKIHSFSYPKELREQSRTKDMVDLILLIDRKKDMDINMLKKAIKETFDIRGTHFMPDKLEPSPESWRDAYESKSKECNASVTEINEAFKYLSAFWIEIWKK